MWGAPWRLTTGEEPILGQGSPCWTNASRSYAVALMDMIDGRTNERNDDGACIVRTCLVACFWIFTEAVDVEGEEHKWERRKRELVDNAMRLCLRVVATHVWVTEYTVAFLKKKQDSADAGI